MCVRKLVTRRIATVDPKLLPYYTVAAKVHYTRILISRFNNIYVYIYIKLIYVCVYVAATYALF